MPDPQNRDIPGGIIYAPQGGALEPATEADAEKPVTHDVDTDDMTNPMSE